MQFMMKLTPSRLSAIIIGGEAADNFVISYKVEASVLTLTN